MIIPSVALVGWMAAWSVINAMTNPVACLLAAASHMRVQLIYGALAAGSNVALSIYLVPRWGASGAIAATVIAYGIFVRGPNPN